MEDYYVDQVEIGILKGKLMDPIRADKPYQTIATEDIGAFVALAFQRPEHFIGLELEVAGSELTNLQAAEVFSRVLGRPVKFRKMPMLLVRLVLGKELRTPPTIIAIRQNTVLSVLRITAFLHNQDPRRHFWSNFRNKKPWEFSLPERNLNFQGRMTG